MTPLRAKYLTTKPLHHSQKEVCSTNDEVHFTYFLIPNYELKYQLFAMANEVEVLEPLILRQEIANQLKEAVANYE